jgi:hypothetical protein
MKNGKLMSRIMAVAAAATVLPVAAFAQARDVGGIATSLTTQTTQVATFVTVAAFVIGVGLAIAGLLKFRAHSQNPNDPSNKMSTAFMLVFVGAAMVAIPATLGSGILTVFGSGATSTDANSGFTALP